MTTSAPQRPYITCRELLDFIADYLDNELNSEQRFEFERHLAVCPSCVNYLDSYKQTFALSKRALLDEEALETIPEELIRSILLARDRDQPAK